MIYYLGVILEQKILLSSFMFSKHVYPMQLINFQFKEIVQTCLLSELKDFEKSGENQNYVGAFKNAFTKL